MNFLKHLSNIPGWKTSRKLVVFESDDWGSIRMPDLETQKILIANGVRVDKNYFTLNDTLESEDDLMLLSEELQQFKDVKGNPPTFTTLHIMGNPDFEKVENADYKEYHWQHIESTYHLYNRNAELIHTLWKDGINKSIFYPSFHGREHLNIGRWMKGLRKELPITMLACKLGMTGIQPYLAGEKRGEYQAAFDIEDLSEVPLIKRSIQEGLHSFKNYFGFEARYFVPPNGFLPRQAFDFLFKNNIEYINTRKIAKVPNGNGTYSYEFRSLGKRTNHNLIFITRNAYFEPSAIGRSNDWVDKCLHDINVAFKWHKPAVISTHRVNYVGGIYPSNRERGLKQLNTLLKRMQKKWPDIEFTNSVMLGDLISGKSE